MSAEGITVSDILADLDCMIAETRRSRGLIGSDPRVAGVALSLAHAENILRICRQKWRSQTFADMTLANRGHQHD